MSNLPVFYFAYADPKEDLEHLTQERKSHHNLLIPRFLKSDFGFIQNNDFTRDDLNIAFEKYIDQITIFHFSGHAATGEIKLQDGLTFIEGIAKQMAEAISKNKQRLSKLVLIFLNGCCTGSMKDQFLAAGVPIVIGTSTPVDDSDAAEFSINFYDSLINDATIKESFESAVKFLQTTNNNHIIYRGTGFEQPAGDKSLWGIFNSDAHKHLLDWKLSDLASSKPADSNKYEINSIIRGTLYNSLLKVGLTRINDLEDRRLKGEDIREDINAAILLGYPGPISYKIARLLNVETENDDKGEANLLELHLNNLYNVYQSLSELMFLIMLSQLWDKCLNVTIENHLKPILPVDYRKISDQLEIIKDFFTTTRKDRKYFDYIPKIKAIRNIFDRATIKYFVDELEQLKVAMESDQEFIACYNYFNTLRAILKNGDYKRFNNNDWKKNCEDAEKFLAYFFDTVSFCTRYDFGILKNIELLLPRFLSKPSYLYRLLKIPKSGNTTYFSFSPSMKGFTSVRSIVMLKAENFGNTKDTQEITGLINLSPFMLDFNVTDPRAEKGNLLMYSHYDHTTGNYLYEDAFRPDSEKYIKKSDEIIFSEIHRTFDAFFEVLFNEKIDAVSA